MSETCGMLGCEKSGRWYPVIEYRAHTNHKPGEATLNFKVCDDHKLTIGVKNVASEEIWESILKTCKALKLQEPVRWLCSLSFRDGASWNFPTRKQ